uniref:Uncharacterized protein n=1 Tax=Leptobrachium leishanense TaxID=445787 RepID=A0A8C5PBT4_9ANUR
MNTTTLGIYVVISEGADATDPYEDVGIIIEGIKILENLKDVATACSMMLRIIYALNLAYPKDLRYTFETIQKIFMELDANKLSSKVQVLKNKTSFIICFYFLFYYFFHLRKGKAVLKNTDLSK